MSVKVFFCYAHEDETLLNRLKASLKPLQRNGLIDIWYDRDISAGAEWEQEIIEQLNTAQIILPLVSPDFMNSDYCYGKELKRALERHDRKEATVIPIILRPVHWQDILGNIQALPTDAKPVTSSNWHSLDEAFFDVAEGIKKAASKITQIPELPKVKKEDESITLQKHQQLRSSLSQASTSQQKSPPLPIKVPEQQKAENAGKPHQPEEVTSGQPQVVYKSSADPSFIHAPSADPVVAVERILPSLNDSIGKQENNETDHSLALTAKGEVQGPFPDGNSNKVYSLSNQQRLVYGQQPGGYQQTGYGQQPGRYQQGQYGTSPYGAQSPLGPTSMGMQPNIEAGLSYVLVWVTGLIFFLMEKRNRFVRFHAMQSLLFFGSLTVIRIILGIIDMFGIPFLGLLISLIWIAVIIIAILGWIILMINGFQGKYYKLPIVGDYAEKYASPRM